MASATCSKVKESIYLNQDVLRVLKKERERGFGEGGWGREREGGRVREREKIPLFVSYSELQ